MSELPDIKLPDSPKGDTVTVVSPGWKLAKTVRDRRRYLKVTDPIITPPVDPPPLQPYTRYIDPGTYTAANPLPALKAGDIWQFDPAAIVAYDFPVREYATLRGGIWRSVVRSGTSWGIIEVRAPGIVLEDCQFENGAQQVGVHDVAGTIIRRTKHRGRGQTAIHFWGSRGVQGFLVEDVDIGPASVPYRSAIGAEGAGRTTDTGSIIRGGVVDQGPDGHFGIECIEAPGLWVDGVTSRGGECQMSFPRSPRTRVTRSTFDMRGMVKTPETWKADGWGIEFTGATDCVAGGAPGMGNTFIGAGGDQHAVSCNTNADRTTVSWNTATDIAALVDGGGTGLVVTDNCLTRVPTVVAYPQDAPGYVAARNGPC